MDVQRIRIIHAADLHLDAAFAPLHVSGDIGNVLREAQLHVFESILTHAVHWSADAICIAGDLFDDVYVGQPVLNRVLEALEHIAPLPVYITPGNRDPYTAESPYALEAWPENVTVFRPGHWQAVDHDRLPLTIHGFGFDNASPPENLFEGLEISRDDRVHIAVLHATEINHKPPEGKLFAPFNAGDVPGTLQYVALGHIHHLTEVAEHPDTVIRYPGTPQALNFEEKGARHILQVEIVANKEQSFHVTATPIDLSEVPFHVINMELDQADHAPHIFDARLAGDTRKQAVQLRLHGVRPPLSGAKITHLMETARERFLLAEMVDETRLETASLVQTQNNTCLSKLLDMMGKRILDETLRENILREAEALELVLNACRDGNDANHVEGMVPYAD